MTAQKFLAGMLETARDAAMTREQYIRQMGPDRMVTFEETERWQRLESELQAIQHKLFPGETK